MGGGGGDLGDERAVGLEDEGGGALELARVGDGVRARLDKLLRHLRPNFLKAVRIAQRKRIECKSDFNCCTWS